MSAELFLLPHDVRRHGGHPLSTHPKGTVAMRRVTRAVKHLIAGSLGSQRVARANAATASVTCAADREHREGVNAYLVAHHAAVAAGRPVLGAEVGPRLPVSRSAEGIRGAAPR